MRIVKRLLAYVAAGFALTLCATQAQATTELIANGNFESGTLAGWTVTDSGSGSWFVIANGGDTPIISFSTPTLTGGGNFVATTDQGGPGTHILSQTLALLGGSFNFSFDARGADLSDSGGAPDQQYVVMVDGVTLTAPIISPDWSHYSFALDLSAGSHIFAFQENDDRLFYTAGLDNVSLTSSQGAVPEPATWAMMLFGFGMVGFGLRNSRKPTLRSNYA